MKEPLVSIIVPTWNGKQLLKDCFDSIKKIDYPDLEVIIVENGSIDGSAKYIKKNYSSFTLIENKVNLGFAGGVNSGIKVAKGEYIALLNNDAYPDPGWIRNILLDFEKNKSIGIISPKMLKTEKVDGKNLIDSAGDFMSKWGATFPRGRDLPDNGQFDEPQEIFSACAGAAVYKKEVFDTIGLFDEDFFAYYEDVDICFRARLAGYKVYYEPTSVVYHQVGGTSTGHSHFVRYVSMRNMGYLYYKNMPSFLVLKYLPFFLFSQLYIFVAAVRKGALLVAIKANIILLFNLPKTLSKRRKIQKERRVEPAEIEKWLSSQWPYDSKYVRWLLSKSSFVDEVKT